MGPSSYCPCRTGIVPALVRVLWVVGSPLALQTHFMTRESVATTFITGAGGFIGTELVKALIARGHQVFGLAPSAEAAERVRRRRRRRRAGRSARTGSVAGRGGGGLGLSSPTPPGVGTAPHAHTRRGHRTRACVDGCAPAGRGGCRHDAADRVCRRHDLLRLARPACHHRGRAGAAFRFGILPVRRRSTVLTDTSPPVCRS